MGKQLTIDGIVFRPRKRFYEKRKKCSWPNCTKNVFGSNFCESHSIEKTLYFHYGLYEFIIPQQYGITAHEYFKNKRRIQFEIDKKQMLKIYPNGKLF